MSERTLVSEHLAERAVAVVRRRTGLAFSAARRSALLDGLRAGLRRSGVSNLDEYLDRLEVDDTVLDDLVDDVTVGESYFMRHPEQFAVVRELMSTLIGERPNRFLRVWSAGCARGEEPYSLAILFTEMGLQGRFQIIASDISRAALARAGRARYSQWSLRGLPAETRESYFRAVGHDQWELTASVRQSVEFRYLNLAQDVYPSLASGISGLDLVLCRNVMIYFYPDAVQRVASQLLATLADGGWLVVGASDPVISELTACDTVVTPAGLAYRRARRQESPGWVLDVQLPAADPVERPARSPAHRSGATSEPVAIEDLYRQRDYGGVIASATAGGVVHAGDAHASALVVRAHANTGDLVAAERACVAAMGRHPDVAELAYLMAVVLAEKGRYREAAVAARRALYLDRRYVMAHLVLGSVLARLGDRAGARRAYRNAETVLRGVPEKDIVEGSDGEQAGRLAVLARTHGDLLGSAA